MSILDSLFGGPDEQTVTTRVDIPDFLRPFLTQATGIGSGSLGELNTLLRGPLVAPFSPDQIAAQGMGRDLATSPVSFLPDVSRETLTGLTTGMAPSLEALNATARGDFLTGGPGFNAALEAARRNILPGVLSTFGRGGAGAARGGLAQTAMTKALADAFAGLYGQERQRQLGAAQTLGGIQLSALPQLMGLNQAEFARRLGNVGLLSGIGAEQQQQAQRQISAPIQGRQQLLGSSLSALPIPSLLGSTSSQPVYSNPLGGLLGLTGIGLELARGLNPIGILGAS